jgi:hypothetical protein
MFKNGIVFLQPSPDQFGNPLACIFQRSWVWLFAWIHISTMCRPWKQFFFLNLLLNKNTISINSIYFVQLRHNQENTDLYCYFVDQGCQTRGPRRTFLQPGQHMGMHFSRYWCEAIRKWKFNKDFLSC